jgi:hypothetical protein
MIADCIVLLRIADSAAGPGYLWGMRADRLFCGFGSQPGVSGTTRWPFSNYEKAVNTSSS